MNDPRKLAAMMVNQVYNAYNTPKGSDFYNDLIDEFAKALDFYGQHCALQRQMDRLLVDDETIFLMVFA